MDAIWGAGDEEIWILQNWTICVCVCGGVISMHFKAFLKVNVQNGNIFWGSLNFEYCFRFG